MMLVNGCRTLNQRPARVGDDRIAIAKDLDTVIKMTVAVSRQTHWVSDERTIIATARSRKSSLQDMHKSTGPYLLLFTCRTL